MSKILYKAKKEKVKAEPEKFIIEGEEKNYITFTKDSTKITYNAINKTYSFKNP